MRRYYCLLLSISYLMITSSCASVPINFALVSLDFTNEVVRINTTTNTVEATIPTVGPAFGIAVTPDAMFAYVTLQTSNKIVRVDLATNMVDTTLPLPIGTLPNIITINPAGTQAWVVNGGSSSITIVNIATNSISGAISLPVGGNPDQVAFTPDGQFAYVTSRLGQVVYQINVATQMIVDTIPLSPDPVGIIITPDGKTAYVTEFMFGGHLVTPINLPSNTLGTPIPVGQEPDLIISTPDASTLFVTNTVGATITGPGTVSPINAATNTAGAQIVVGPHQPSGPIGIAITPDGSTVYVALHDNNNAVVPIDVATLTVGAPIIVGAFPRIVATPPFPPLAQKPTAMVMPDQLLNITICGITIQWATSNNPMITSYQIFQDGVLIGTVQSTDPLSFTTFFCSLCNTSCFPIPLFTISSVTSNGSSAQVPVVIL